MNCTLDVSGSSPLEYILRSYVATALIVGGLVGNVLIVVVVRRREMSSKANQGLIALALWDSSLLLAGIMQYTYVTFRYGGMPISGQIVYGYMFLFPWSNAAKTGSVWTTLATALERYFAVAYPLKYKCIVTGRKIRCVLICTGIAAVAYCIPRIFEIRIEPDFLCPDLNETRPLIVRTKLRSNPVYYTIVYVVMNSTLILLGPFVLQAILMARIGAHVRGSAKSCQESFNSRKSVHKRKHQERSITAMLLVVQVKFLICFLTPVALNLTEMFLSDAHRFQSEHFLVAITFSDISVLANSALNFPIYTLFTSRFRMTLKTLILHPRQPRTSASARCTSTSANWPNGTTYSSVPGSDVISFAMRPFRRVPSAARTSRRARSRPVQNEHSHATETIQESSLLG